jgi:hypothetical protein
MMKMLHNLFIINYIFKIASLSTILSNLSNYALTSISSIKLRKGLQPILKSLSDFYSQMLICFSYLIANDIS